MSVAMLEAPRSDMDTLAYFKAIESFTPSPMKQGAATENQDLRVVLPNIRWGIAYGVVLTAARTLGEFGGVLLVSGGLAGKTETATLLIYRELEERHDGTAHAVAVVLAVASILILVAMELLSTGEIAISARLGVSDEHRSARAIQGVWIVRRRQ